MIDKETGNSRGFGFVTYADCRDAAKVMLKQERGGEHVINRKRVEIKRAEPKGEPKRRFYCCCCCFVRELIVRPFIRSSIFLLYPSLLEHTLFPASIFFCLFSSL
jgi:RNA recognition motif-containing protein